MKAMKVKTREEKRQAYEAWYDEQVRLGLEHIKAGRVLSHEEAMRHMDQTLAGLARKHGRKAA
jgi:predicted transcriptional regulator